MPIDTVLLDRLRANDPTLSQINIEEIAPDEVEEFFSLLENNEYIKKLNINALSGNRLSSQEFGYLFDALSHNESLQEVTLGFPMVTGNYMRLMKILDNNFNLTHFHFSSTLKKDSSADPVFQKKLERNLALESPIKELFYSFIGKIEENELGKVSEEIVDELDNLRRKSSISAAEIMRLLKKISSENIENPALKKELSQTMNVITDIFSDAKINKENSLIALINEDVKIAAKINEETKIAVNILANDLITHYDEGRLGQVPDEAAYFLKELKLLTIKNVSSQQMINALKNIQSEMEQNPNTDFNSKLNETISFAESIAENAAKGINPICWAASSQLSQLIKPFFYSGININAADPRSGFNALHIAAQQNSNEILKLLIDLGANQKIQTKDGRTALEVAVTSKNSAIEKIFADYNKNEIDKFLAHRRLHYIFGGKKLESVASNEPYQFKTGGDFIEAVDTLAVYLQRFSNEKTNTGRGDMRLDNFINILKESDRNYQKSSEEILQKVEKDGFVFSPTGYNEHLMGYMLEKNSDGSFSLHLAERGVFASKAPKNTDNKISSITTLQIPNDQVLSVIGNLKEILNLDKKTCEQYLYTDLPNAVGNEWKFNLTLSQSKFKTGICFFGNLKSLILHEFSQLYGEKEGKEQYKAFTLFLRKQVLQDYKEKFPSNDPYIKICESIVEKKEQKLFKR